MREILFKAKNIATGEWVEGSLIDSGNHEQVFIYPHFDGASTMSCRSLVYHRMIAVYPDTICQYTELIDKNGNKIWENDIVSCGGNLVVTWKEKFTSFCLSRKEWVFNHFFGEAVDGCDCEVIGNTFDNPDLLKGE